MLQGPIYSYECYKYLQLRKIHHEFNYIISIISIQLHEYGFQLTSVKKGETHSLKHVVQEY